MSSTVQIPADTIARQRMLDKTIASRESDQSQPDDADEQKE